MATRRFRLGTWLALAQVASFGQLPVSPVEGCIDARLESNLFLSVPATLVSVLDDEQVKIRISGNLVDVLIVAISVPKATLQKFLQDRLGQDVEVGVNSGDWVFADKKPKRLVASIYLKGDSDLGLALIRDQLARYKKPPPYKMSRYSECVYQREDLRLHPAK